MISSASLPIATPLFEALLSPNDDPLRDELKSDVLDTAARDIARRYQLNELFVASEENGQLPGSQHQCGYDHVVIKIKSKCSRWGGSGRV